MTIAPEILTAAELRCDVAGIWALAISADPVGRQARREILTAALEEAAPMIAAAPERTLDAGLPLAACTCACRQCGYNCHCSACYKERRLGAIKHAIERAVTAERAKLARELKERADDLDALPPPDDVSETEQSLYTGGMRRAAHLIEHGDVPAAAGPAGETP
jgi:hypothetical protein